MKRNTRFVLACLLVSVLLTVFTGTVPSAVAGTAPKKIDPVRITFSYAQVPKAGEAVGTFQAVPGSREYTVESAEYTNSADTWSLGDRPRIMVVLQAKEGCRFSYTSSSHFKLNGCGADFIRAKVYDGGGSLELEAYFKYVEGALEQPDGLEWDGTYAKWDELMDAKEYEVRLYRNGALTDTVTTRGRSFDFSSYFSRTGDYTFRVRAIAKQSSNSGPWSDYSEANTITSPNGGGSGPGTHTSGGSGPGTHTPGGSGTDRWERNQYGWWYCYSGGGYPAEAWKLINGCWYYFNRDGYMVTGWQHINGKWYYLDESGAMLTSWRLIGGRWYFLDGSGVMLTGWQLIDGKWYFLDESGAMATGWQQIDGSWYWLNSSGAMLTGWQLINGSWYLLNESGVMLTGWQLIDGKWYFLDGSGAMYAGRRTPDGYYVDGNGAYVP